MIGKIKQWLGIEGIKLEIILPEEISRNSDTIEGIIRFTTMNTQRITETQIILIERYTRGRRKNKKTDEYELGRIELDEAFMVYPEESKEIPFELPFNILKSKADQKQERGGISGLMAATMKSLSNVKSEFRIEAESRVAGTALNPFDKKRINFAR